MKPFHRIRDLGRNPVFREANLLFQWHQIIQSRIALLISALFADNHQIVFWREVLLQGPRYARNETNMRFHAKLRVVQSAVLNTIKLPSIGCNIGFNANDRVNSYAR